MIKPLMRWNRSGLSRFRYIDGNAVTFLEALNAEYRERLLGEKLDEERVGEIRCSQRSDDWGQELLRAFSRSAYVVTEHINEFANEMTVPTAARWESLRKLADSVNFIPASPVSATAYVALMLKDGAAGVIPAGLQVASGPELVKPLYFETRTDGAVDARLNRFFAEDYDCSPEVLKGSSLVVEGTHKDLKSGIPFIIEDEGNGKSHAAILQSIAYVADGTRLDFHPPLPVSTGIRKGAALIHCNPEVKVGVVGPASGEVKLKHSVMLTEEPDLMRGDIVGISDGQNTRFAKVRRVSGKNVTCYSGKDKKELGTFNVNRTYVSRALEVSVCGVIHREKVDSDESLITILKLAGDWTWTTGHRVGDVSWIGDGQKFKVIQGATILSVDYHAPGTGAPVERKEGYSYLKVSHADMPGVSKNAKEGPFRNPQKILLMPRVRTWKMDRFLDQVGNSRRFDQVVCEMCDGLVDEKYAVLFRKNQVCWGRLSQVSPGEDRVSCQLKNSKAWGGGLFYLSDTRLVSSFKKALRCVNWQVNETALNLSCIKPNHSEVLSLLVPGKLLYVDAAGQWIDAVVTDVDLEQGCFGVSTSPKTGRLIKGQTAFIGNVCKVMHGKKAPAKVYSTGKTEEPWHSIVLDDTDISFIPDPAFSTGAAADVQVTVHGERWTQVEQLSESSAADPHYQIVLQDSGALLIRFGDGVTGRMVAPGKDNILVSYRRGCGLDGNCPAGTLKKLGRKHAWVKAVVQPSAAFGGNSREPESSMRGHVADRLYAMDRAVSVEDFARLASLHSSIWQAVAFRGGMDSSRSKHIEVVVVPAGGTALHEDVKNGLKLFLEARSIPGTTVTVNRFKEKRVRFDVTLFADLSRFDRDALREKARAVLMDQFKLLNVKLGEPLRIGRFYKLLEALPGVAHSTVRVNDELLQTEWTVARDALACINNDGSNLTVQVQEVR